MSACAKGLSNPEKGPNVMDDRCGTVNSVAAGVGEQLHDGRVFIHILLAIAIVVVLIRIIQGRKPSQMIYRY
jgi:hypothetical protein